MRQTALITIFNDFMSLSERRLHELENCVLVQRCAHTLPLLLSRHSEQTVPGNAEYAYFLDVLQVELERQLEWPATVG